MEILALIPARGGSKGIPRKNIRSFAGFPLIAYSIAAGLQSKSVTRVIVSTDDTEIAAIAKEWGAEAPFTRPTELAQDQTTDLPVFEHALQWLKDEQHYNPEVVIQLRPTSPIRPRDCVDRAVKLLLENHQADCVRGVVPAGQNPYKMWRLIDERNPMTPLLDAEGIHDPFNVPRQVSADSLDMVSPAKTRRPMPDRIELIVLDFDGVVTDNRVWTDENGHEIVAAYRSDSLRIPELRQRGIEVLILSSEPNPVVQARALKMGVSALHGIAIHAKGEALRQFLSEKRIDAAHVVFVGNDRNDLSCIQIAGWAVAVADAYPEVLHSVDHILSRPGGYGAVRELCDLVLKKLEEKSNGS